MRRGLAPSIKALTTYRSRTDIHRFGAPMLPEVIGATLGAAIAFAVLAVAYQRWGWAS